MKLRDIVLVGLLSAVTTAGKLALSFIPNVEIVTLFFILFAVVLGMKHSLFIAVIFVTTDILIYGFSTWVGILSGMAAAGCYYLAAEQENQFRVWICNYRRLIRFVLWIGLCHKRILFLRTCIWLGILDKRTYL